LAVACALTVFRVAYYGALLPNTAVAKLTADPASHAAAWSYLLTWLARYGWLCLFGVPVLFSGKTRRLAANGWLLIGCQTAFVLVAGGDWMPQWRFLLPAGAILAVMGCHSVHVIVVAADSLDASRLFGRAVRSTLVTVCLVGLAAATVTQLWHFRTDRWALDYYRRQLDTLDRGPVRYVAARTDKDDLVLARDIGILGYRASCRILDVVGLTDTHVARTSGFCHRDRIDLNYIFDLKPRYLMLQSGNDRTEPIPLGRVASVLVRDDRFRQYRLAGRWELPGRHYCEVYERIGGSARPVAAAMADGG
jgi:hypothetical protein